ncbi:MAG: transglycosylase family protein, partial [Actinomycetota bacterium]|nr:transglycosylase family protein [Actinomycetota bacterium]
QAAAEAAAAAAASATQGLPVNGGLVSVVTSVVAPPPQTTSSTSGAGASGVWLQLRQCESGGNYQEDSGNGYFGAYQFSQQTWTDLGYPGRPDQEPPATQDAAAQKLQAESGWGQWPACAAALGLT